MHLDFEEHNQQKPYAIFDIDGTITSHDTFAQCTKEIIFNRLTSFLMFVIVSPLLLLASFLSYINVIDKRYPKGLLLWICTVGLSQKSRVKILKNALKTKAHKLILKQASAELIGLEQKGYKIVFVTASHRSWLSPVLKQIGLSHYAFIGTQLKFVLGGVFVKDKNCYHTEKINRLKLASKNSVLGNTGNIFFINIALTFSDHPADIPMLSLCQSPFISNAKMNRTKKILSALPHAKVLEWHK
jgi:phosphoserine phosphatase